MKYKSYTKNMEKLEERAEQENKSLSVLYN